MLPHFSLLLPYIKQFKYGSIGASARKLVPKLSLSVMQIIFLEIWETLFTTTDDNLEGCSIRVAWCQMWECFFVRTYANIIPIAEY